MSPAEGDGADAYGLSMRHQVYAPAERPDVEVLVDGVWCVGELRMWSHREDGSWVGDVQWRPTNEPTRMLGTFPASEIRRATNEGRPDRHP